MKRVIAIKMLPDGSGRVVIHWLIRGEGPITTPRSEIRTPAGPRMGGGVTGKIACQPERKSALPEVKGGEILMFHYSDDCRAVTCPDCMATPEFARQMELLSKA
jgi:hypothetical protein